MRAFRVVIGVMVLLQLGCGWYPRVSPRDDPSREPSAMECGSSRRSPRRGCTEPRPQPPERRSPADSIGIDTLHS